MTSEKTEQESCEISQPQTALPPPGKILHNTLASWVIVKPRVKSLQVANEVVDKGLPSPLTPAVPTAKRHKIDHVSKSPGRNSPASMSTLEVGLITKSSSPAVAVEVPNTPPPIIAQKEKPLTVKASPSASSNLDNFVTTQEYEVDFLLAKKGTGAFLSYLVKWKGYEVSESTWEPAKHLSCREIIAAFEETLRGLPEPLSVPYDPAMADIIAEVPKKALPNLKWLPKNISDFLLLVNRDTGPSISVVNTVDESGPPKDFVYIAKNIRGEGVPPINHNFDFGCNCKGSCHLGKKKDCSCLDITLGIMPYDKNGLLLLPPKHAIQECTASCNCPPTCRNRVIQRGRTVQLQIFKTAQKGWGVRALERIPKGRFVAEYVGEIINNEEAERRGVEYDSLGLTYLFDLDYNYGPEEDCPYSIDAFKYGNVTHFINHSCDPNLAVYTALYESSNFDIHNLAFFAIKDIAKYEELCFDYSGGVEHEDPTDPAAVTKAMNQVNLSERSTKYPCHCGADNCRKFVHIY